jgi:hypothetical protein
MSSHNRRMVSKVPRSVVLIGRRYAHTERYWRVLSTDPGRDFDVTRAEVDADRDVLDVRVGLE